MGNFVDKSTIKVRKMKDISGSRELQNAMLDFLSFEKKLITTAFLPFEKLSAKSADKGNKYCILDNLTVVSKQEDEKIKALANAQKAYGAKNGF